MHGLSLGLDIDGEGVRTPPPPPPPTPVTNFVGVPTDGIVPLRVVFRDLSTHSPYFWRWEKNGGDGWEVFSSAQNPEADFEIGTWSVRLTTRNASGSSTKTRIGYVIVSAPVPVVGSPIGLSLMLTHANNGSSSSSTPPPEPDPRMDFSEPGNSMYVGAIL